MQRLDFGDEAAGKLWKDIRITNTEKLTRDHIRDAGWWRVAQTFTCKLKFRTQRVTSDDTNYMQGQLLQVTFAPVWMQFCDDYAKKSDVA